MKECFKFETANANVGNVFWRSISLLTKFVCFFGCLSTLLKRKLLEGKISPCLIHLMSAVPVLEPRQILQSPYTYTSTHAISISQPSLFWPKKKIQMLLPFIITRFMVFADVKNREVYEGTMWAQSCLRHLFILTCSKALLSSLGCLTSKP